MKNKINFRSAAVLVVILVLFLGLGSVAGAQSGLDAESTDAVTVNADTVVTSRSMQKLAGDWAKAVKDRDGKSQYALMSEALQPAFLMKCRGLIG